TGRRAGTSGRRAAQERGGRGRLKRSFGCGSRTQPQRGQRVRQGVFQIQHVNAYRGRLKNRLCRFDGGLHRHLANYLGWRRLLDP
ncbi:MAG: hypothetical protein ACREH3_20145, partial [Geminicoccales bacterium]